MKPKSYSECLTDAVTAARSVSSILSAPINGADSRSTSFVKFKESEKRKSSESNTKVDEYKIEKGVPIPFRQKHGGWRMALEAMEIGDSFFVSEESTRQSISQINRSHKVIRVTTRKVVGGYRIWRVK